MYETSKKTKQSQSIDSKTAGIGENLLDLSLEEEDLADLASPKKSVEIGDGSKFDEEPISSLLSDKVILTV